MAWGSAEASEPATWTRVPCAHGSPTLESVILPMTSYHASMNTQELFICLTGLWCMYREKAHIERALRLKLCIAG